MLDLLLPLLRNTGLLAVVGLVYGVAISQCPKRYWNVLLGVICGLGAVLAMLDPTEVRPGVLVDSRTTMIMLSGLFGGPVGALIAGAIAISYRIHLGGIGALAGITIITMSFLFGIIGHYLFVSADKKTSIFDIQLFALCAPLLSLGVFALPAQIAWPILQETFVPLAAVRIVGTVLLGMMILHERHRVDAEREVRRLAFVDELSGLPNRRSFYLHLDRAWARWKRYANPFAIVMVDIDRFKLINDNYGHPAGDEVIKRLGFVLSEEARESDIAARLGGEEFALLLSNTSSDGALIMAERIRRRMENELIEVDGKIINCTISAGISADLDGKSIRRDPLSSSDQALYEAKRGGRNRIAKGFAEAAGRDGDGQIAAAQNALRNTLAVSRQPDPAGVTE
ncbi:diguanylate cyclase [Acuticoccus sp. MNP-M23]|uniref:GGDEF domain-containing protein n=1 Tax=Acuticoccus sp. MNP-M23 TaxID=3072793 RepID=UPI0028160BB0|nr:diguanylate cyclase [Acuticoccus sp. MNP-M23]WMS42931.1 diguanylate cyclase [Acuticoccus sp. MNP-M23]